MVTRGEKIPNARRMLSYKWAILHVNRVNNYLQHQNKSRQSWAKMFWKLFPRTSRIYFPPPPLTMLIFSDRTKFWNTEIVIFNIDMGEGGRTVYLSQRNIENYAFSKNFCTRLEIGVYRHFSYEEEL